MQNTKSLSKALFDCGIIKKQVEFIYGKYTEIKEDRSDKDNSQLLSNFQTCLIFIQEGKVFILVHIEKSFILGK